MSTTAPDLPFGAQLIGRTEKSLDVLLKRVLVGSDLSEPEYVALRVCSDMEGKPEPVVTAQLAAVFRKGEDHAAGLIESLRSGGLVDAGDEAKVALTPAGRELHGRLVAETNAIAGRLWSDLPAADLAVAASVLNAVLRRAATEFV